MSDQITKKFEVAEQYYQNEQYDECLELLEEILEEQPECSDALYLKGMLQCDLDEFDEAIECLEQLNPNDRFYGKGTLRLVMIHHRIYENYEDALELLEEFPTDSEQYLEALHEKASIYRSLEEYQKAIAILESFPEDSEKYGMVMHSMGVIYGDMEQYEKQLEAYNKVNDSSPYYGLVCVSKAVAQENHDDEEGALKTLLSVLPEDPYYLRALTDASSILKDKKRFAEALSIWENHKSDSPIYEDAVLNRAQIYYEQEQYHTAIESLNAIKKKPDNTNFLEALELISQCYRKLDNQEKLDQYRKWHEIFEVYLVQQGLADSYLISHETTLQDELEFWDMMQAGQDDPVILDDICFSKVLACHTYGDKVKARALFDQISEQKKKEYGEEYHLDKILN